MDEVKKFDVISVNKLNRFENCEAMTSSTHLFACSYGLLTKCFVKNCETLQFHIPYF